ncbi:MAG: Uma2 family endonuclease [Gemmatimonadaceae bacterium]
MIASVAEVGNTMAMPAETFPELMTADQLLTVEIPGKWTELIRGHLVGREPPSTYHGIVSWKLDQIVGQVVRDNQSGVLCGQDTGFKIESNPDTVRAPDLAFIASHRLSLVPRRGYAPLAPDLVAEVVSVGDRPGELLRRVGVWLNAGVRLVWVIDPERTEARVHRPDGSVSIISKDGTLNGEDVLPGFSCPLAEVLTYT